MNDEKSLAEILLNQGVESEELASKWIEHLTSDERDIIENPAELRSYRDNIYTCVMKLRGDYVKIADAEVQS